MFILLKETQNHLHIVMPHLISEQFGYAILQTILHYITLKG